MSLSFVPFRFIVMSSRKCKNTKNIANDKQHPDNKHTLSLKPTMAHLV